jgi:tetratricopeptide (TPR) repeat protein
MTARGDDSAANRGASAAESPTEIGDLVTRAAARLRLRIHDLDRDISVQDELADAAERAIEMLGARAGNLHPTARVMESLAALAETGKTAPLLALLATDASRAGQSASDQSNAYLALGAVAYADSPAEAVSAYRSAAARIPSSVDAWRQLGHALRPSSAQHPHEDGAGAMDAYQRVLDMGLAREDPLAQASAHAGMGALLMDGPELALAGPHLERALALERALGREALIADQHRSLGLYRRALGEVEAAQRHYLDALAIDESLGRATGVARTHLHLASLHLFAGDVEPAIAELHAAAAAAEGGRLTGIPLTCYTQLGELYAQTGRLDNAARAIASALRISESVGDKEGVAAQSAELGLVHQMRGNGAGATQAFTRARDVYRELGQDAMAARADAMLQHEAQRQRLMGR